MGDSEENASIRGRAGMSSMDVIDILMATCNGEKYLKPQLDSILRQSRENWRLIIRDDCSTDETVTIIKEYQQMRPEQIFLIQADKPSGSAQNNFFALMEYAASDYIAFADQDDIWLNDKLELIYNKLKELEREYGTEIPLMVHTDLTVVDENLKPINSSLFAMQNMDATGNNLNHFIVQKCATGCTMMVNQALLNLVTQKPKHAVMHDMWLALIAAAFGKIGFIDKATILYRQHENNANGAKKVKSLKYIFGKLTRIKGIHQSLVAEYRQAEEFLEIYWSKLSAEQCQMLKTYAGFEQKTFFQKLFYLKKYHLWKKGIVRVMGQLLM